MKERNSILLFLIFYSMYQHSWFMDLLGSQYYLILHTIFIVIFILITGDLEPIRAYSPRRLTRRSLLFGFGALLVVLVYRLTQCHVIKADIRPVMLSFVLENGPISIVTFMEDLFFIGIVFETIRRSMYGEDQSSKLLSKSFLIPFLISFYWFLEPHQYSNHFLNSSYSFWTRVNDFPGDILFGFFCGTAVFVKTRSLILSGLVHVLFNGMVWWIAITYFSS